MTDRRLALVVAVDSYDQPALHRLAAPAADAAALADVLGDPALGAFEVETLHNPTSWAACEQVEQVLADRRPGDLVLLHFSCHGLKDDSGELYLAAVNTKPDRLDSSAVQAAWVNRVMQRSRAQRVVLMLDCCYGGAFERGVVARAAGAVDVGDQFDQRRLGGGRGRVVITASTAMEYAFEGTRLAGGDPTPSIFTGALVEGIRTGDADRDQDGQVALGELYEYVYDRVREQTPYQTPSKWEFGLRGDFYVALNPHHRRGVTPQLPVKDEISGAKAPEVLEAVPAREEAAREEAAREEVGREEVAREEVAREEVEPAGAAREEVVAGEATAESVRDWRRPSRPVLAGAIGLVVVLATALTVWIAQASSGHPGGSPTTSPTTGGTGSAATAGGSGSYQALLALLPSALRGDCQQETPDSGNKALAICDGGEYRLWASNADLNSYMAVRKPGDCTSAPSGADRHGQAKSIGGKDGLIGCQQLDQQDPVAQRRYCVEWAITAALLTGTFYSDAGPGNYEPDYRAAMTALAKFA